MERDFELNTILSIIIGEYCSDDIVKVYDLASFVYDKRITEAHELTELLMPLKEHLLKIHPQLKDCTYNPRVEFSFDSWLRSQQYDYGKTLSVCKINPTLEPKQNIR